MEKNLNDILKRDDYKKLTKQLKERVEEIAGRIREKMDELDIASDEDFYGGEIGFDSVVVRVAHIGYYDTGRYKCLVIKSYDDDYGCSVWHCLEDVGCMKGDDGSCMVRGRASNKETLAFLNVAKNLIEGLGKIEQEQIDDIQKTLKETKDL